MYRVVVRGIRMASLLRLNTIFTTTTTNTLNPSFLLPLSFHPSSSFLLHFSSNPSSSPCNDFLADVSTEELKNRIKRYEEGDNDALPLIFEAILARKLSGKHEDTDDEIMEDFRTKYPQHGDHPLLSDGSDPSEDSTDSDTDSTDSDTDSTDSDTDFTDTDGLSD